MGSCGVTIHLNLNSVYTVRGGETVPNVGMLEAVYGIGMHAVMSFVMEIYHHRYQSQYCMMKTVEVVT